MRMDFPFTQPICSHDDATDAMHAVHWWRAHSIEDGHEIADRVIEIAAFRSCGLIRRALAYACSHPSPYSSANRTMRCYWRRQRMFRFSLHYRLTHMVKPALAFSTTLLA
jgi:hypothetical protein